MTELSNTRAVLLLHLTMHSAASDHYDTMPRSLSKSSFTYLGMFGWSGLRSQYCATLCHTLIRTRDKAHVTPLQNRSSLHIKIKHFR